ncbi:MAG: type II toxin-antitoxin system prevent-host-death family antitoxin [Chloroflexi bacterium]|nr:MAG: type II toxin-antitoxin system prevent-host-death family antitoxin [Chloroflexota bacterium]
MHRQRRDDRRRRVLRAPSSRHRDAGRRAERHEARVDDAPECGHKGVSFGEQWAVAAVGVRELKAKASEIIERSSRGERFLVTRRSRPTSVLLPIDEDLEDFILAHAPEVRSHERTCTTRVPRRENATVARSASGARSRGEASSRGASSSVATQSGLFIACAATRSKRMNRAIDRRVVVVRAIVNRKDLDRRLNARR